MRTNYKGCELEVSRERSCGGWIETYYSIFDDGYEVTSGFSNSEDSVAAWIKDLKRMVDEYRSMTQEEWEDRYE